MVASPSAWVTVGEVRERVAKLPAPEVLSDERLELAIAQASDLLARLSSTRPRTSVTVAPVPCPCGTLLTGPYDALDVGAAGSGNTSPFYWRVGPDLVVGARGCRCELLLPDNPVIAVTEVTVAGDVVPPADYTLIDAAKLRRTSGSWSGPVVVTYTTGAGVSEGAKLAVSALAAELAKAGIPGTACALPERVTSVVRDGVSFTLLDPQLFLDAGRTGIYLVDLFLAAEKAPAPRPRVRVLSPDSPLFDRLRSTP